MVKIIATDRSGELHEIDAAVGDPLMYCLNERTDVEATCGGCASCGTCHIYVADGWVKILPPRHEDENSLLEGLVNTRPASRIACQIIVANDMNGLTLTIAPGD